MTRSTLQTRYTPERRLYNLLAFFGWQGGTIHQVARATGVDADTLLHAPHDEHAQLASAQSLGSAALETCSLAWRRDHIAPKRQGDAAYWIGVADALSICEE